MPDKCRTAYSFFCEEHAKRTRAATSEEGQRLTDNVLKNLRKAWTALSDEGRAKYKALQAADKERFRCECKARQETLLDVDARAAKRVRLSNDSAESSSAVRSKSAGRGALEGRGM